MTCALCDNPTRFSAFCIEHEPGWVKSPERKLVDFISDESYNQQTNNYAARIKEDVYGTKTDSSEDAGN